LSPATLLSLGDEAAAAAACAAACAAFAASSIAVAGDANGGDVDENAPL
jgi:hypothetical protein